MLTRVHITHYKSLADVEVKLEPLTVLFGPNAAGKSNLLDALQLLSKLGTSRTLKDAFDSPYRGTPLESFRIGKKGIKGLVEQERLVFSIEADLRLSDAVVNAVDRQVLRVADEYLAALTGKGEPTRKRKPFFERQGEKIHLRLEGQAHPTHYDRYLDHAILSMPHYPPHYPHLVAARRELESWLFFYFEPRERMRAANPVKEVRHIGLMGEELAAFLNTVKADNPSQFRGIEKALHTLMPNIDGIEIDLSDLGEVELRLKEGGVAMPARVLSEGTLRMLGLLALTGVDEHPALVGFEEPENGVHPGRIQLIAELLKTRRSLKQSQYIVTTHSPILPDLLPDSALFVVRRTDGKTRVDPFSTWGPLDRGRRIGETLSDDQEPSSISERILRGDFDA